MDILPSEEEQMIKNVARELLEAEISTAMVREMELDEEIRTHLRMAVAERMALRVTIASESKDESGEAVSRARPSAKEIERVLAADKA